MSSFGFTDYLLGPDCGIDIYEETSEDKWSECAKRKARIGSYSTNAFLIVILVLIIFFGSTNWKVWGTIIIGLICIANVVYAEFFSERFARVEHQRYQKELNSYMTNQGMSKSEAVKTLIKEKMQREENAARVQAANIQASAIRSNNSSRYNNGINVRLPIGNIRLFGK